MIIVSWCSKMVLNLEVKMSIEPVIEGGLVDIACCLELGGEPVQVMISVQGGMIHLCYHTNQLLSRNLTMKKRPRRPSLLITARK